MIRPLLPLLLLLAGCATAAPPPAERVARFDWFDYRGDDGLPAPGRGEYGNPILQG